MAPVTAPGGPAFRNGLLAALSDEDVERLRRTFSGSGWC